MGETVISNLLSKDVICALAEWGLAILEKGPEIYFRKPECVEFKKVTSIFSDGRKLNVAVLSCILRYLAFS